MEGSADLRFIDKKSGAIIYEMPLGAAVGPTMTYLLNGKQFIVAVVNGAQGGGAELVGLAVGQPPAAPVAVADAVDEAAGVGMRLPRTKRFAFWTLLEPRFESEERAFHDTDKKRRQHDRQRKRKHQHQGVQ